MFKGFFAGLAWGGVLAVLMVVVANEMAMRHEVTDVPVAGAVELPAGSAFDAVRTDVPPSAPGAPEPAAPEALSEAAPAVAAPQLEGLPEAGGTATAPSVPSVPGAAPEVAVLTDTAPEAAPDPGGVTDARPGLAPAAELSTEAPDAMPTPVAPVAPAANDPDVTANTEAPAAPVPGTQPDSVTVSSTIDTPSGLTAPEGFGAGVEVASNGAFSAAAPDAPLAPAPVGARPGLPDEIAQPQAPAAADAVALPLPGVPAGVGATPDAPPTPDASEDTAALPGAVAEPAPLADEAPAAALPAPEVSSAQEDTPDPVDLAQAELPGRADTSDSTALTPAQAAAQRVQTGRLVQTGVAEGDDTEAETDETAEADPPEEALLRNAAAFENPEARPLVALVLLDGGDLPLDLPFQASFAIDPLAPDAAVRASVYRASGHDIVVVPRLPEGASATDVAQAIEGSRSVLSQAVAMVDPPEAGLASNRTGMEQVLIEARDAGLGFLTFARGLNAAQRMAEREGVVTAAVERDLDADGQDSAAVKRFLDQAAFRARQEGAVIVFARVRPETVAALSEWILGNRAQSVSLAPLSAVMAPADGS